MSSPVFVDVSGRRAGLVGRICWVLAGLALGYVVLVAVALVAPSNVFPLRLPGLPDGTAPSLTTSDGATHPPAALATSLPTPSARPDPSSTSAPGAQQGRPTPQPSPVPVAATGRPVTTPPTPAATPSRGPSARPTTAATPSGRAVGRPTTQPTVRATPSKPPHP